MRLNVPYYKQTTEFTCGPACVLMTLKYFNPKTKVSRNLELEIWRETNLIGTKGASIYGLSLFLLKRGLKTTAMHKKSAIFQTAVKRQKDREVVLFTVKELLKRAKKSGLKIIYKNPSFEEIRKVISKKEIPIFMIHMGLIHKINAFHWVIITGIENDKIWLNDPYPPKGKKNLELSLEEFTKILNEIKKRKIYTKMLVVKKK